MQSSICLADVDEGGPTSTERDGQPPASEPSPVKTGPPQSGPLKPEAFLARQRQLGSLGGKCAGSVGENKFLVQLAVDGRARCQLRTCKEPLQIGELRLGTPTAPTESTWTLKYPRPRAKK